MQYSIKGTGYSHYIGYTSSPAAPTTLPRLVLATLHTISSSVHIQGLISAINAKQRIQSKFFLGFKKICSSHTDKKTWKLNPDIQALLMKNEKQAGRQAGRQVTRYNNAIATKMTTVARNRKRT